MQLPYEIWKMIVSYLSVGRTKQLYTVNSALFNIAMDLRYQEARFWTGKPKARVRKDLRVFCYPHLSCRPKTLHVDLSSLAKSLSQVKKQGYNSSLRQIIPLITSLVTKSKPHRLGSVSEIVAVVLDTLPQLTAVTKLYIIHDYSGACRDDPLILQLLRDIWQIFGDRLQSLQVQVAFENLELLLPTSLHLPYLKVLTVNAEGFSSATAIACESIIPTTIQSHASSLRNVSFMTQHAAINPQPIFQSLQNLPCLQAIDLSFPFIGRPFPAYNMLYNCRQHLKFLSLSFGTYMGGHTCHSLSLFHENWCTLNLPHIRELRINPPIMLRVLSQEFVDYIHRFAQSLISLWIKPNLRLDYREVKKLCSIFPDFLSLRNLTIYIYWLCPDILALLAQTLPGLQTLSLLYDHIVPNRETLQYKKLPYLFYQAMQQHTHVLHEWQLVSLDYCCSITPSPSGQIERALADHLPNVEWFCGVERSIYVSQAKLPSPPPGFGIM